jgi:diacylglycerol kinase family enzyme
VDGKPIEARVLLAANNAYELSPLSVGRRERLDEGRLYLYSANGLLPHAWEERSAERFELDSPDGPLEAAIDGEPAELETPLELAIEPGALRLLVPRAPGV